VQYNKQINDPHIKISEIVLIKIIEISLTIQKYLKIKIISPREVSQGSNYNSKVIKHSNKPFKIAV
jgi:hypothetical protein